MQRSLDQVLFLLLCLLLPVCLDRITVCSNARDLNSTIGDNTEQLFYHSPPFSLSQIDNDPVPSSNKKQKLSEMNIIRESPLKKAMEKVGIASEEYSNIWKQIKATYATEFVSLTCRIEFSPSYILTEAREEIAKDKEITDDEIVILNSEEDLRNDSADKARRILDKFFFHPTLLGFFFALSLLLPFLLLLCSSLSSSANNLAILLILILK